MNLDNMNRRDLATRATAECGQLSVAFKDPSTFFVPQRLNYSFDYGRKTVQIPSRKASLPSPPLPPVPPSTPIRDNSQRTISLAHEVVASYPSKSSDITRKRFTFPAPSGYPQARKPNACGQASSWIVGNDSETQVDASSPGPSVHSDADTATISESDQCNQQFDESRHKPLQRSPKASTNLYHCLTKSYAQPASSVPEQGRLIYRKPVPSSRKTSSSRRFSLFEKYRSSSAPSTGEVRASVPLLVASLPITPTEDSSQQDDDIYVSARASSALPHSFMDFESDDDEPRLSSATSGVFSSLSHHVKNHHSKTRLRRGFSSATNTFRTMILCGG